jgi:acyl transferase domain-containing protein/acyl-CoA synthetase (AMP-forming)/AMP-acid ligase II/acyl carrier protein
VSLHTGNNTLWWQLEQRAEQLGDEVAFRFLGFDGESSGQVTWSRLRAEAAGMGRLLAERTRPGDRALLVYDSGLGFLTGFFGCLLAGVVPAPAPPPRKPYSRSLRRLDGIKRDCDATVVLASPQVRASLVADLDAVPELADMTWLEPENAPVDAGGSLAGLHPSGPDDLAYLQYTSGSTSQPKGVAIAQRHVVANCLAMDLAWRHDRSSVMVTWLPVFHDMGLVYSTFLPLCVGFPTVMMRPPAFVREPARWLRAVQEYRGTHAIAPNFGFDMCVRKVDERERASLDLSSWRVAANASEPIRAASMRGFAEAFEVSGFRAGALAPAYGLAEATLLVTAAPRDTGCVFRADDHGGEPVTSSGRVLDSFDIRIVDPDGGVECAEGELGEIWVRGPSIADGYLDHPEETGRTFGGELGGERYLRTGDLGFFQEGELYVRGRLKDVMVFAGQNHYPQDVEATACAAHPSLRPGCAAAFSIDDGAAEQLVVLVETADEAQADPAMAAIRRAISEEHGLSVAAIVLLPPKTVHKTSSGKIQRSQARRDFQAGALPQVAEWHLPSLREAAANTAPDGTRGDAPADANEPPRERLRAKVASLTGVAVSDIRDDVPLATYGLDSVGAAELAADLQRWTGRPVPDTVLYDRPTIDRLVDGRAPRAAAPRPARRASDDEPIAVIGLGCRFPGAAGPEMFWDALWSGRCAIGEVPPERRDGRFEPEALRRAGLLDDPGAFDATFFQLSAREARNMDPQQRMLLEVAWETLEDAGYDPGKLAGHPLGVFIGLWSPDAAVLSLTGQDSPDPYLMTGIAHSIAANRISYALDLAGPSMTVDTACSSSLVAIHLAAGALRSGECEMALAGGANVLLSPAVTTAFAKAGLLSPTGTCRSFGADANGYVRAEGTGLVALKTLSRAEADGDEIYAVIRGTAVVHEGRTNGLTAPSQAAQEKLLLNALARAGVRGADIDFVEAHGSGTPVGDKIEAQALGAVLGDGRPPGRPCAVGSVKSGIGHLEAAAGVAGLIKVCLALREHALPASLGCADPNPEIDFAGLGLAPHASSSALPESHRPLLAGVSSFGFGGAIAHAVIEQYPVRTRRPSRPAYGPTTAALLPLSAEDSWSLARLAHSYATALSDPGVDVAAFCLAAAGKRTSGRMRAAVCAGSRAELVACLEDLSAAADGSEPPAAGGPPVFVFSGQGGSWTGMGAALFAQDRVFRTVIEACDDVIRELAGWSLIDTLHDPDPEPLAHTDIAQPAQVAVQLALTDLVVGWGIRPAAVTGHSLGEIAAGYAAGALDLRQAVELAVHRGRVLARAQDSGGMTAVRMPAPELAGLLDDLPDGVAVAAWNAPGQAVLSGPVDGLESVEARLARREARYTRLPVNYPGHAPSLAPLAAHMAKAAVAITAAEPAVPWWSTVLGSAVTGTPPGPDHWAALVHEPVRFAEVLTQLIERGARTFVEIGPRPLLTGAILETANGGPCTVLSTMRPEAPGRAGLLRTAADLFEAGHDLDWPAVTGADRTEKLPPYPWHHRPMPLVPGEDASIAEPPAGEAGLYEVRWTPGEPGAPARAVTDWLVFADGSGVGERLAAEWRSRGIGCRLVSPPDDGTIADPAALWEHIRQATTGLGPDTGVLYSWCLDRAAGPERAAALAAHGPAAVAATLLTLPGAPRPLRFLTRGAAPGRPGDRTPAAAPAWGLVRALLAEWPDWDCAIIDVDDTECAGLAEVVENGRPGGQWVRSDGRWLRPTIARVATSRAEPRVRSGGTYLVTGGLGAIGRRLLDWLDAHGAGRIVVAGRSAAPGPLPRLTAEVEYHAADLADGASVRALVDSLPRLDGVVHAAGVLEDASLRSLTPDLLDRVLAPKLHAGWHLLEALNGREPDFVLLLSSAVGSLGSAGQAAYCAANAYLDAAAAATGAIAVGFGPWSGDGLAEQARLRSGRTLPGLPALEPGEGVRLTEAALAHRGPIVLAARIDEDTLVRDRPLVAPLFGRDGHHEHGDPVAEHPPVRSVTDLTALLRAELGRELGVDGDSIEPDVPFRRLGLDSLASVAFATRLKRRLGRDLPPTLDLNYPTLRRLADHLAELLGLHTPHEPPSERSASSDGNGDDDVVSALATDIENLNPREFGDLVAALMPSAGKKQQ